MLDYFLSRFAWYRRWRGGHWEKWDHHVGQFFFWEQVGECSLETGFSPRSCYGPLAYEDYWQGKLVERKPHG